MIDSKYHMSGPTRGSSAFQRDQLKQTIDNRFPSMVDSTISGNMVRINRFQISSGKNNIHIPQNGGSQSEFHSPPSLFWEYHATIVPSSSLLSTGQMVEYLSKHLLWYIPICIWYVSICICAYHTTQLWYIIVVTIIIIYIIAIDKISLSICI